LFVITCVMIFFVIRYRRSKNPEPADIRGNLLLEITWVIIPSFIAISMFISGWKSYTGLRNVPKNTMEISVIGQSFSWIFIYPNEKETENLLVVPVNKPVKLNLTSDDVLHSLYIPAFRIKIDAVKGMHTYAWFLPEETGEYDFQCTEFCGSGHSDMLGTLKVVTFEEYTDWLEQDDEW
ncbi:MAG: cytochrome c oxidase subunit II, partial [Desulfobacula sp.]|nr:cytochrome c oxidase subunit II [Desulfobacula sp.]